MRVHLIILIEDLINLIFHLLLSAFAFALLPGLPAPPPPTALALAPLLLLLLLLLLPSSAAPRLPAHIGVRGVVSA